MDQPGHVRSPGPWLYSGRVHDPCHQRKNRRHDQPADARVPGASNAPRTRMAIGRRRPLTQPAPGLPAAARVMHPLYGLALRIGRQRATDLGMMAAAPGGNAMARPPGPPDPRTPGPWDPRTLGTPEPRISEPGGSGAFRGAGLRGRYPGPTSGGCFRGLLPGLAFFRGRAGGGRVRVGAWWPKDICGRSRLHGEEQNPGRGVDTVGQ